MPALHPIDKARALNTGSETTFEQLLAWHLRHGVVWSAPGEFLLGIPGHYNGEVVNLDLSIEPANCWLLTCAVGKRRQLVQRLPFRLPLVAWHRNGGSRLFVTRTERIERL
jgi:hypothetical protein